jgi:hypothetical protein
MSAGSGLPQSFYELNYLVSEGVALRVRDFVQGQLNMDEYSAVRPNYAYPVHALCLDSDDLTLYRRAVNDIEHRYQLRVRYLSSAPDQPAHLEIKRRMADAVIKERCSVRQEAVPMVLGGELLDPRYLAERGATQLAVLQRFLRWSESIQARPRIHIGFLRECYRSDDGTVRVTMDRCICCEPCFVPELGTEFQDPCHLFPSQVLLELSYAERFPNWFRDLVEHFSLEPCEADKFVAAVSALGSKRLGAPF